MTEKHLKKCSKSLIIIEMQIKTILRFHLTSLRMARIKNSGDSKGEDMETEEYQMAQKYLKKCSTSLVIREIQIK